jgi:hypothetical protein
MSNNEYGRKTPEDYNNKPNYKERLGLIVKTIGVTALVTVALYGAGKSIELVKDRVDHLNNPYQYSDATKIVVIPQGQGLNYAAYTIDGVDESVDVRRVVNHIEQIPENKKILEDYDGVVPAGAGILVPVSIEKNDD